MSVMMLFKRRSMGHLSLSVWSFLSTRHSLGSIILVSLHLPMIFIIELMFLALEIAWTFASILVTQQPHVSKLVINIVNVVASSVGEKPLNY